MMRFDDQAFVITGGTSGIGLATALGLAREGGRVLVTGTSPDKLRQAEGAHEGIHGLLNDAGDPAAAEALAAEAERQFGRIDGAFLNAGKGGHASLDEITPEFFHDQVNLNLGGVVFGARALVPLIRDGGAVLATGSAAQEKGYPGQMIYSATKGAVRAFARALAAELAPRGVRVNTLMPGPVETEFFARHGFDAETVDQILEAIGQSNPLGRVGRAEEAAAVALFLLSDASSFVTGANYAADGGQVEL